MFSKYLSSLGLTIADVNMVRLGEAVEAQALAAGSIDGVHVTEPYLSPLLADGHELVAPDRAHTARTHYAVLVFGPTLTITHRDVGQRFMRAYLRGVKTFNEGLTARNVEIMASRTGVEADRLRVLRRPTVNRDGELDFPSLLEFQKWLVGSGNLGRVLGAEAGTDMTFARKAARELGISPTPR